MPKTSLIQLLLVVFGFCFFESNAKNFCQSFKSNGNQIDYSFDAGNYHFLVINQSYWKIDDRSTKIKLNSEADGFNQFLPNECVMTLDQPVLNGTMIGLFNKKEEVIDWFDFNDNESLDLETLNIKTSELSTKIPDNLFGDFRSYIGFRVKDCVFGVLAQNQDKRKISFYEFSKDFKTIGQYNGKDIQDFNSLSKIDENLKVIALFKMDKHYFLLINPKIESENVVKYCILNETCSDYNSIELIDCNQNDTSRSRDDTSRSSVLFWIFIYIGLSFVILLTIFIVCCFFNRNSKNSSEDSSQETKTNENVSHEKTDSEEERTRKKEEYGRRLVHYYQRQSNRDALNNQTRSPSLQSLGFEVTDKPNITNESTSLEDDN